MAKKKVAKKTIKKISNKITTKKAANKKATKKLDKKLKPTQNVITNDVIMISVDRNYLALRSQELVAAMTHNSLLDPDKKDGNLLALNFKLQGANEMILDILEKYDFKNEDLLNKKK